MAIKALITGITGQDGSYLAELLLEKGYEVHGLVRRTDATQLGCINHLRGRITLHRADLLDQESLVAAVDHCRPREVYNFAAQSSESAGWSQPVLTGDITGLGVTRMLEAVLHVDPTIRFCQAGSSRMFGNVERTPQDEQTPMRPCSPYGAAKAYGHWIVVNYRESHNAFACSAILFGHESPRRSKSFVSRKVSDAAARIKLGIEDGLVLGNLDVGRDWGFAGDYVDACWRMLQQDRPDDYVVASGETHSIRELLDVAFGHVGLDWRKYVVTDPKLFRRSESNAICGDASKARRVLGWKPRVSFDQLIHAMVDADLEQVHRGL